MPFSRDESSEGWKLLLSFKPNSNNNHPKFQGSPRAKIMLKALQVTAGLTLGVLAWDRGNRPLAAKRYTEAIEVANTYPGFTQPNPLPGLETYIHSDLQDAKDNLATLKRNDDDHALRSGQSACRKDFVDINNVRVEGDGNIRITDSVQIATDACANCGKREAKMKKCSKCKTVPYCGRECQIADWRAHKARCREVETATAQL